MRVPPGLHKFTRAQRIERHACQIDDPVARLRFLRRKMSRPARRFRPPAHPVSWVALAALVVAASIPVPTGTAETLARERRLIAPRADSATSPPASVPRVWQVDRSATTEVYSNGLRIDLTYAVSNRPREPFPIYPLTGPLEAAKTGTTPAGIVYHTTESHLAPFEEDQNRRLTQLGRNVLEAIRQERAYHYVIDRFGRVFRVVEETDAANHTGNSIWADANGIYVNLNDSFIGVAFEGQTDAPAEVTPAQIDSARMLTQMLRSRYAIPAEDCVTHAQVSINPLNMKIGNHTDWADDFPFAAVGLPNNYSIPPASIYAFGFRFDDVFVQATGGVWKGLNLAMDQVVRQAAAQNLTIAQYRAILQRRYKNIEASLDRKKDDTL